MSQAQEVHYGWRLSCSHPGCTACIEEWSNGDGPPYQSFHQAEAEGWFVKTDGYAEHPEGWCQKFLYRVYCPEHSAAYLAWQEKLDAWKQARWEKGKETHTTLFEKFRGMACRALGMKVGQTVEEWVAENPRPLPPWEVPDAHVA